MIPFFKFSVEKLKDVDEDATDIFFLYDSSIKFLRVRKLEKLIY